MKAAERIEIVPTEETAIVEFKAIITPEGVAKKAKEYMALKVVPDDAKSYETVNAARMVCVHTRTGVDKRRKELNEDDQKRIKARNDAAKKLVAPLAPVEEYLDKELGREDGRRADIKARKAQEEKERVEGIRARISALQNIPLSLPGKPIADLNAVFDRVFSEEITEAVYMEFAAEATGLKDSVLDAISAAIEAREKADKEEAARKVEAERLEKVRQEQEAVRLAQEAEAKRLDDLRKADEEKTRKEREAIEAEKRKVQEERDRAEFERLAKERAEAEARAKVEREEKERKDREAKAAKEEADRMVAEALEKAAREARRPDREKLLKWVKLFNETNLPRPDLKSDEAETILTLALDNIEIVLQSVVEKAEAL